MLIATGAHAIYATIGEDGNDLAGALAATRVTRPIVLGAALSIDNLVVGFALGADHAPLLASIVTIGVVSVVLSLLGLELGARLGERVERFGELVGGGVLILVGVAVLTGAV